MHCTLVDRLCVLLQCPRWKLAEALKDVENQQRVCISLARSRLRTNHLGLQDRYIEFSGMSMLGANRQYAYRGYLGITVQQHMYAKHKLKLRHADLPCIEENTNAGHINYFPIEFLMWEPALSPEC